MLRRQQTQAGRETPAGIFSVIQKDAMAAVLPPKIRSSIRDVVETVDGLSFRIDESRE